MLQWLPLADSVTRADINTQFCDISTFFPPRNKKEKQAESVQTV